MEIESWPQDHVAEWREFYLMQPFGPWRDNMHAALIASTLANSNRPKGSAPITLDVFMYRDADDTIAWRKQKDLEAFEAIAHQIERVKRGE
jgi:hypothetical protein